MVPGNRAATKDDGSALRRAGGGDSGRPGGATVEAAAAILETLREVDSDMTVQVALTFLGIAGNEGIGPRELSEKLGLRETSVSRNVGILAEYGRGGKAGYRVVEIRLNPQDRRLKHLYLTPAGDKLLRRALRGVRAAT